MLNVAVVGLGVGFRHAQTVINHQGANLKAVCDFDKNKLNTLGASITGLGIYDDCFRMLNAEKKLDILCICSEDKFHFEQAKHALVRGIHCFVEKPICQSRKQAEELSILASRAENIELRSNFVLREEEVFHELKGKISSGGLGDIFLIEASYDYGRWYKVVDGWRGTDPNYSGVLGGAIHLIDLIAFLFEEKLIVEYATSGSINSARDGVQFPDLVYAICRLKNGAIVKVSSNLASGSRHYHQLKIYGSAGTFSLSDRQAKYFLGNDRLGSYESAGWEFPSGDKSRPLHRMISDISNSTYASPEKKQLFETLDTCFSIIDLAQKGVDA